MTTKKGQIWIETVLYTVIGIALIGVVLAIAMPKINQSRERIVVEQTIGSLNTFDNVIREVVDKGPGNKRIIQAFTMKRGSLYVNSSGDELVFTIDGLSKPYSEPGVVIPYGNLEILSVEQGKKSSVSLTLTYNSIANLTVRGGEAPVTFTAASVPYSFEVENLGIQNNLFEVNIIETSGRYF